MRGDRLGIKLIWQTPNLDIYREEIPSGWPEKSFLLSENELHYCLKSPQPALQRSRAQLRLMVKEIFKDAEVEVSQGPLGRPHFDPRYDISFSHKAEKALVGVTKSPFRLGIDIESLAQKINWHLFKDLCFLENDRQAIAELTKIWNQERANLALFSLKEAYFKALDQPFTPASVQFDFVKIENQTAYFSLTSDSLSSDALDSPINLFSFLDEQHVISVCHWKGIS